MSSLCNKKSIAPVQCHGTTNRWGTLLRGRLRHRCALSSMAVTVVRSWSGFCGFHPWISGFWVGRSGLAGWGGCRDSGSGEGRCAACPIIIAACPIITISGSPLRAMCTMLSSLTHWGLNKMPTFVPIFLNNFPDRKFQIELRMKIAAVLLRILNLCSNWTKYHWLG